MSTMFAAPRMNKRPLTLALIATLALSGVVSTASAAPTGSTTHIAPIQARVPMGFPAVTAYGTCSPTSITAKAKLTRVKNKKNSVLVDVKVSNTLTPKEYWAIDIQNDQTSSQPAEWVQAHNSKDSKVHFTITVRRSDKKDFFTIQVWHVGTAEACGFLTVPTP